MSEADKIFEDLGYRKKEVDYLIIYTKHFNKKERNELNAVVIGFDKLKKQVYGFSYYNGIDYGLTVDIPMQELKAINKKCEELGWL